MKNLLVIFLLLCSGAVLAKAEGWYFQFGLGMPFGEKFPTQINEKIDTVETSAGGEALSESKTSLDFGLYFPTKSKNSIWGLTYTFSGFSKESDASIENYVIGAGIIGLSYQTFTGSEAGSGLFFRFDIGRAAMVTEFTSSASIESKTYTGYGGLAGVGLGLAMTEETRVLLGTNYNYVNTSIGKMVWLTGYIAFLW